MLMEVILYFMLNMYGKTLHTDFVYIYVVDFQYTSSAVFIFMKNGP